MAQPVKRLALDLRSSLDLGVVSSGPALGSMLDEEPTSKNKRKEKKRKKERTSFYMERDETLNSISKTFFFP